MKKFGKFLAMAIMVVLVSGAQSFAADSVMSTVLGPGWQCLLIPTSFYQPGTIFSIDNATGEKSRIISLKVPIQKGPAAFPKSSIFWPSAPQNLPVVSTKRRFRRDARCTVNS